MSRKFEVLEGSHIQNGHLYTKGQIVSSPETIDLTKEWKNKFKEVDRSLPDTHGVGDRQPALRTAVVGRGQDAPQAPSLKDLERGPSLTGGTATAEAMPQGKDMTVKFPKAVEQDFKVFKRDGSFYVYNGDDLSQPLNETGVDRDEVDGVVAKNS
jgi:hypothetical protein